MTGHRQFILFSQYKATKNTPRTLIFWCQPQIHSNYWPNVLLNSSCGKLSDTWSKRIKKPLGDLESPKGLIAGTFWYRFFITHSVRSRVFHHVTSSFVGLNSIYFIWRYLSLLSSEITIWIYSLWRNDFQGLERVSAHKK